MTPRTSFPVDDLDALKNSRNCCIYKVPKKLRMAGGDRYDPHVVSIGPYHYATAGNLEVTTELKKYYVNCFIFADSTPNEVLGIMENEIGNLQSDARLCYAHASSFNMDDKHFREMLILDGCFILGVLCRYQFQKDDCWRKEDILFNNKSMLCSIRRDLVLLENQVPYKVLAKLFDILDPRRGRTEDDKLPTLKQLIMSFFDPILPISIPELGSITEGRHILDLLRQHLIFAEEVEGGREVNENGDQSNITVEEALGSSQNWEHTTYATELEEAGVKFKKKVSSKGLLDISFKNGEFEIPPFYFGESWTILLPNMIAMEQCHGEFKDMITSYVLLMDNLVDSRGDVKLLFDKGIITGSPKEHEIIAKDINNLSKEAIYEEFYYERICQDVNKYRKRLRPKWRAYFIKNYINTPWALLSVNAAILLLLLALAQTVISVLSWRLPKDGPSSG